MEPHAGKKSCFSYATIARTLAIVGLIGFVILQGVHNYNSSFVSARAEASAWIPSVWSLSFLALAALAAGVHMIRAQAPFAADSQQPNWGCDDRRDRQQSESSI